MSKTPFLDFLKKLSEHPALSKRYFSEMLEVFKDTGLSEAQVRALASGERKLVAALLEIEWCEAGNKPHGGALHGVSPLETFLSQKDWP